MSIRVRAVLPTSVSVPTPETLRNGILVRLPVLAAYYGEDGAEDAAAHLRVDEAGDTWDVHYGDDPSRSLRVERRTDPAAIAAEVAGLREGIADCDEDGVDDVHDLLDHAVETVGVELSMSDVEGLGWVVAVAAAAWFAEQGDGLIQADQEGWMVPEGRGVDQVLDGD